MNRRRFEHFHVELSVALDRLVPRYALWLHMNDLGSSPEDLGRNDLLSFFDDHLDAFLDEHQFDLPARRKSYLRASLRRFEPEHTTPYEFMERISAAFR